MAENFDASDAKQWAQNRNGGGDDESGGDPGGGAGGAEGDAGDGSPEEEQPADVCEALRAAADGLKKQLGKVGGFELDDKKFKKKVAALVKDAETIVEEMNDLADEYEEDHEDDEDEESEGKDDGDEGGGGDDSGGDGG